MSTPRNRPGGGRRSTPLAALQRELEVFTQALASTVEDGAGIPEFARVASRALTASVAVVDSSGSVIAMAGASKADERELMGSPSVRAVELRVAGKTLGQLRFRPRRHDPPVYLVQMLATLISLEIERQQGPVAERAGAARKLIRTVLDSTACDPAGLRSLAQELGLDLDAGVQVIAVRAKPRAPQDKDWREQVTAAVQRAARQIAPGSVTVAHADELFVLIPGSDAEVAGRIADLIEREFEQRLPGLSIVIGRSQVAQSPETLHNTANQALLAMNVAAAHREVKRAWGEIGAYRLLLPTLVENPDELRRFVDETVGPLLVYEEQYQTGLISTLQTFLAQDAKIEATAQQLFAHRHTVRYRLERIRDLTGLDVNTSEGREKLSLGLKAMHALGITAPRGP